MLAETKQYDWSKLQQQHWAFRSIKNPNLPAVQNLAWPKNDVDYFVLAQLETAELTPAPSADPQILVRRLYYDLIGLPPTAEQTQSFLAAAERDLEQATRQLVDLLLQSPHYGERWGRHWLDVARYSDGHGGFSNNAALPHAWRYRDWVVDAFNRDSPFDEFIRLQIAGDILDQENTLHVATGFFSLGPTYVGCGLLVFSSFNPSITQDPKDRINARNDCGNNP